MPFNRLLNLNKKIPRRMEISAGGKWYLLLTLGLGIVAINSNNNVIYLLESLLLSSLIFSGILSDYTVARIKVSRKLHQAISHQSTKDSFTLFNNGIFPLFCVELGEWKEGKFIPLAYALHIPAKTEKRVLSQQVFSHRGLHSWENLAVATSFPFGFARKIRLLDQGGRRIVWPKLVGSEWKGNPLREPEMLEGEVRALPEGHDVSKVHWLSSARSDQLMQRPFVMKGSQQELELHYSEAGLPGWERKIEELSFQIHKGRADQIKLKAKPNSSFKNRTLVGRRASLDGLALLPSAGEEIL